MSLTKRDVGVLMGLITPQITVAVDDAVSKKVNGKIDTLSRDFQSYRADDEKWKREQQPALDNMKSIAISAKTIFWIAVSIGGLSAFLANLSSIISLFHHG